MKHTDFYNAIQAIEELAKNELAEALKAVGGEFIADYTNEFNPIDDIILVGAFKHSEGSEDILFTRALATEYGIVEIYGKPYRDQFVAEEPIEYLEACYMGYIIDAIPETDYVFDVEKDNQRRQSALQKVREALEQSV